MDFRTELTSYSATELMNGKGIEILNRAVDYTTFVIMKEMIICRILESLEDGTSGLSEKAPIPILNFKRECDELALSDERFKNEAMAYAIATVLINNDANPEKAKEILELALEIYAEEVEYESE